jgi:SAM-dependent methyltransferase
MTIKSLMDGRQTILVEPDAELIGFARKRVQSLSLEEHCTFHNLAIESLNQTVMGPVPNILCLDVFEHIEDPVPSLKALCDILLPGGVLIVAVPALPSLYGRRDVAYGHYRRYTHRDLKTLLNQVRDWEVTSIQYWNLLGVPPYFFYEKVVQKPINDTLRQKDGNALTRMIRGVLSGWLQMETIIPPPRGLSLLAVARKL